VDDWGGGFVANAVVTNHGAPLNGWQLTWRFTGNQQITNYWGAELAQSGQDVTAGNAGWNANLGTGGTASFGFQAQYSGGNAPPTDVRLNGTPCTVT
jgi:cellulase/cellobiase CelA1